VVESKEKPPVVFGTSDNELSQKKVDILLQFGQEDFVRDF